MRQAGLWVAVGGLLLGLLWGVASLYRLRVGRGDVFPEYSSLRADPLGVRALHDAAGLLPGRTVERWTRSPERLEAGAGDVVLVAGLSDGPYGAFDEDGWKALDRMAVAGARVVVAWRAERWHEEEGNPIGSAGSDPWAPPKDEPKETGVKPGAEAGVSKNEGKPAGGQGRHDDKAGRPASDHERRWGFRLGLRVLMQHAGEGEAVAGEDAPEGWPVTLPRWRSDWYFLKRPGDGWRVLLRRGLEPVMMERTRGAGSVVLLADSYVLSNEAVQRDRATPVLAEVLGGGRRVIFVESHLGLEMESGVAVLARHYGLGGAALTALVLAVLWVWRRAAPLAPIMPEGEEVRLVLAPTAGLEALLRRAVAPAKLFAACTEAWRAQATAGDRQRLDAAMPAGADSDPVAAYNAAARTLSHKRIP